MDTTQRSTGWNRVYSLWHIPSSTLLVTTLMRDVAVQRVQCALTDGVAMDDLMLQVTAEGELIGAQHLGARIIEALQKLADACMDDVEAS